MYDEQWKRKTRGGKDFERPKGCPTPCWRCPKSEDGKPNPGAELSAKNVQAYEYYRHCLVDDTHLLPRDLLVVHNNAVIRAVEDGIWRSRTTTSR